MPRLGRWPAMVLPLLLALPAGSCVTNPATGGTMLSLVSESQEIRMGQEYAQQVEAVMSLVDDRELQAYVDRVGQSLAAVSERPGLPWSFKIVDDPVVNAFALPGGPIYVTRGLMTHLSSEAEMASVIGHEIGHVTARHSVEQISRQQLAGIGLAVGAELSGAVRRAAGAVGAGLSVLFLSYSRDDEHQSDLLGVRYASREGYDVREAVTVHRKLERITQLGGGRGVPDWLSSHPSSEDRIARIQALVDTFPASYFQTAEVGREAYLTRVDGLVFGENPRDGFFRESRFLHPDLEFELRFPAGWKTANLPRAVLASSPEEDAILELMLAAQSGHRNAAREFFSQAGLTSRGTEAERIGGFPATIGRFEARTEDGSLEGIAAFVDYGGRTYRILGYTVKGRYRRREAAFTGTLRSFRRLTDRAALNVQPMRIALHTLSRAGSIAAVARSRPSPVSLEQLAVINGVGVDETIAAGTTIKWVVGRRPPGG